MKFSVVCLSFLLKVENWKFFFQNLLQQTWVNGQPERECQKPGAIREDTEQESEKNKVNAWKGFVDS